MNKPTIRKTKDIGDQKPEGGQTRPPDAPLNPGAAEGYEEAVPKGDAHWSQKAAVSDPDVDDTKGGE